MSRRSLRTAVAGLGRRMRDRALRARFDPVFTRLALRFPDRLPVLARLHSALSLQALPPPFDSGTARSSAGPARRRSVLFLHNSYYHFLHLAAALRRRGWDALLVSIAPPDSAAAPYFHGEDLNLWHPDPTEFGRRLREFFATIPARFSMVHFAGMHHMSLFPSNFDTFGAVGRVPWDFLELKRQGVKIGYTVSGCQDGLRQSAVRRHSGGICGKCVWELDSGVCSDRLNHAWGRKLEAVCDLIACEEDWALEYRTGPTAVREPLTMCLDPEIWRPDLEVPPELVLPSAPGEIRIMHAYGNQQSRARNGRDIKGTGAITAAVEQLRAEGAPVRLDLVTNVPSRNMRYLQVQADVIVDQLIYGRYGAQSREGMMLGRPTVCYLDNRQAPGLAPLRSLAECPLVQATEETIYDVLKRLVASPEERRRIGRESRAYALKWHSADACAARYERVYARMLDGLPLEADAVYREEAA